MKLSEIITYIADNAEQTHLGGYLLFSKFEKPYIKIVENLDDVDDDNFAYRVINPEKVTTEYLYHYLVLHIRLLRKKYANNNYQYGLNYLTVEFINNIEVPASYMRYSKKTQHLIVRFMRKFGETNTEPVDSELDGLLQKKI